MGGTANHGPKNNIGNHNTTGKVATVSSVTNIKNSNVYGQDQLYTIIN